MGSHPARTTRSLIAALAAVCVIALIFCNGCKFREYGSTQVGGMAFEQNPFATNTVYVSESGTLIPYIVLTNNYNDSGKTILLREHIMDEPRYYGENAQGNGYYAGSEIDEWLNGEYLMQLGSIDVADAPIKISTKDSLGHCGLEVEVVWRKAFLLSWLEVGGPEGATVAQDGSLLAYFASHTATSSTAGGVAAGYMLRSAMTCYNDMYSTVGANGQFGGGGLDYKGGVRPAFCVESSAEVEFVEDGELGKVPVLL